ncbi:Squalene epoxidase, partial [Nowakowskiella sp. JEL0078]
VTGLEAIASKLIKSEINGKVTGVTCIGRNGDFEHTIFAPLVIVADGCFSKFRTEFVSRENISVDSHFGGFLIKNCNLPHIGYGHVVLAKPAPILLYQVGPNETRILVDIPGKLPKNMRV